MDINLNNVQHEPIEVTASLTAALNRYYVNTASATYTDPTPVQGEGFIVYVKNGTATVGGTGYSTVGSVIYRYYHSGAWGNTVLVDPSGSYQPLDADLTSIAGLTSTSAYLRRSAANTYVLDNYATVASNLPSTGITAKILTGLTQTNGFILPTDSILSAFETLDSFDLANSINNGSTTMLVGQIVLGNAGNVASIQTLTLSGTGGTFGLSGTGVLTMPNADAATRGFLLAADFAKFQKKEIQLACSDETTALTTGTSKVTFRMPYAATITGVRASLSTAQTSGNIITVDINEGGTSILSTKLTIDNTEKTSTTATTAPVISDTSVADDAEITIDIDQVGDGTAKGLKVTVYYTIA